MKGRRNEPWRSADDLARDLGQYIDQSLLIGRIDLEDIDEDNHGVPTWTRKRDHMRCRVDGRRGNYRFSTSQEPLLRDCFKVDCLLLDLADSGPSAFGRPSSKAAIDGKLELLPWRPAPQPGAAIRRRA